MIRRFPVLLGLTVALLIEGNAAAQITLVPGPALMTPRRPEVITVADFNEDGFPDAAVNNNGSNKITIVSGTVDGTLASPMDLTLERRVERTAAGHLNCDRHADLAVVDRFGDRILRITGNGDGTFNPPEAFAVAASPQDVAIGNFDGKYGNDLVSVSSTTNAVTVLLNRGGNLGFNSAGDFPVGDQPVRVVVGDLDGDGLDDIVALDAGMANPSAVAVLLNTGHGQFGLPTQYALGVEAMDIAVADFNNDGVLDIIALSAGDAPNVDSFSVFVLLNRTRTVGSGIVGTGSFELRTPVQVIGCPATLGGIPITCSSQAIAVADYDDDGAMDFAVSFSTTPLLIGGDPTAGVLSAYAGHGDGTFDLASQIAIGLGPKGIAAADFNGDTVPDIAVAEAGNLSVRVVKSAVPAPQALAAASSRTLAATNIPVMDICAGDCDCSGDVTIDEVVTGISIAVGSSAGGVCPAFDGNDDHAITVDELLAGVNNALAGCVSRQR